MWFFELLTWVFCFLVAVYALAQLASYVRRMNERIDQADVILDRLENSAEFLDAMARFHYKAATGEPLLNRPVRYEEQLEPVVSEPEQAEPGKATHNTEVSASLFGL